MKPLLGGRARGILQRPRDANDEDPLGTHADVGAVASQPTSSKFSREPVQFPQEARHPVAAWTNSVIPSPRS